MKNFSIILPTYNEKKNIILLINKIISILKNFKSYEIIVVDDNSKDNTYNICKKRFIKNKRIKVLLRKKNKSLGSSILYGINKSVGKKIIVMDTDFTHDPNLIIKFLQISNNVDMVIGSRFCSGGSMINKKHYYASLIYNIFLRIVLRTQVQDNLGGYFCIKRNIIHKVNSKKIFYGYGDYFFRLIFYLLKKNVSIIEIPTMYNLRYKGSSKSNFIKLFIMYSYETIKLRFFS
tara:strand:- start:78 stop:776 length:699 start_codon:yes stop_codon:yes gene_type:complete